MDQNYIKYGNLLLETPEGSIDKESQDLHSAIY